MNRFPSLIAIGLMTALGSISAQEIENSDFFKGKTHWQGDGKVVYLDTTGTIKEIAGEGDIPLLRVTLTKSRWSEVKQLLRPTAKENAVNVSLQVMASADYAPLAESRDYSPEKFGEGGGYAWSAEVTPKCEFMIRLKDSTWYYRPFSLKPYETWKRFSVEFPDLTSRSRSLSLLFPPGSGSVYLRGAQ